MLLVAAFVPAAHAQLGTQTTVLTSPAGPEFTVDGATYFNAMSAFWPVGSQHTLFCSPGRGVLIQSDVRHSVAIPTMDVGQRHQPRANHSGGRQRRQHAVHGAVQRPISIHYSSGLQSVAVYECSGDHPAQRRGRRHDADLGVGGSSESLQAVANPGWVFAGWQIGGSVVSLYPAYNAVVNAGTTATAVFNAAKPVTLATNPPKSDVLRGRHSDDLQRLHAPAADARLECREQPCGERAESDER